MFKDATTASNNNKYLSKLFDEDEDINNVTQKFMKRLDKTINRCFRKIRVTEKVDEEKEGLFKKWKEMKRNLNDENKVEFLELENKLVSYFGVAKGSLG